MDEIKIKDKYLLFLEKNQNFFLESISEERYRYFYFDESGVYHGEKIANQIYEELDYYSNPEMIHKIFIDVIRQYIQKYNLFNYEGKINFKIDNDGSHCLCYNSVVINKIAGGDYLINIGRLINQFNPTNSFLFSNKIKFEEIRSEFCWFKKHWYSIPEYRERWIIRQLEKMG